MHYPEEEGSPISNVNYCVQLKAIEDQVCQSPFNNCKFIEIEVIPMTYNISY